MGGHKAVQEIREKEQARDAVSRLPSPAVEGAPLDVTQNPMVGKRASQLVSAANALRKYTGADVAEREQAQAEAQAAREEKAAAKEQVRAQRDAEHKAEREKTATERAQAMAERAQVKAAAAAAKAEQVKQKEEAKAELAKAKEAAKVENDKVKAAAAKVRATKIVSEQPKAEAPKAEAPKADAPYEPIPDDLLTRRHKTDEQVAASEVSDYEPGLQKKYAKNIMFRRSTLRNRLEEVASDANDVDSSAIGRLYHQMDHSHSQREVQRHLAHWTSKMDPATKQAIHAAVAPLLKLWKE
jgi:Tfp pilus assembly protein FimV